METHLALYFGVALQVHNMVKFNVVLHHTHAVQSVISIIYYFFSVFITFYHILFS